MSRQRGKGKRRGAVRPEARNEVIGGLSGVCSGTALDARDRSEFIIINSGCASSFYLHASAAAEEFDRGSFRDPPAELLSGGVAVLYENPAGLIPLISVRLPPKLSIRPPARAYPIQTPPLMSKVAPVMKPFHSPARNTTARATSSGVPAPPRGMPAMVACALSGAVCVV